MKLQLKTAIVDHLDSESVGKVKGGTATELTSAISSLYPSCACAHISDKEPIGLLTELNTTGK